MVPHETLTVKVRYDPFFNTYNVYVPGMSHQNPPADVFEKSLRFVDAPSLLPKVKTYEDWEKYAFRLDAPHTVFSTEDVSEVPPVALDPTLNRLPQDDYDGDGLPNWYEYLINTDPMVANGASATPLLDMDGKDGVVRCRADALDTGFTMLTSSDLEAWDDTGAAVQIAATTTLPGHTMSTIRYTPTATNPAVFFYRPQLKFNALVNLTQLPGASASQSTTAWGGPAHYAIDGNRDGVMNHNSTTHTDLTSANWWQVDLGAEYDISRIQFFNRTNHQSRLSNFRVSVLDASGAEVVGRDYYLSFGHVGNYEKWDLSAGTRGSKVKFTLLGNNRTGNTILSLAEVEVLGPPVPSS